MGLRLVGPLGIEPRPKASKALMLRHLHYGPVKVLVLRFELRPAGIPAQRFTAILAHTTLLWYLPLFSG